MVMAQPMTVVPLEIANLLRPFLPAQAAPSAEVDSLDSTVADAEDPAYEPVTCPPLSLNPTFGLVMAVSGPKEAVLERIVLGDHLITSDSVWVGLGLASAVQLFELVEIVAVTVADAGVGVPPEQPDSLTETLADSLEAPPALVRAGLKEMVPFTPEHVTVPVPVEDLCGLAANAEPPPTTAVMPIARAAVAAPMTILLVIFTCTPPD
jgi:hypothetical protein